MVKYHIDLWVEMCPWRVVFDKTKPLAPSCWLLARACDPLPIGAGFGIGIGWPLGGPRATQASPKGHAGATQGSNRVSTFVCNKSWKNGGEGGGNRRHRRDLRKAKPSATGHRGNSGRSMEGVQGDRKARCQSLTCNKTAVRAGCCGARNPDRSGENGSSGTEARRG